MLLRSLKRSLIVLLSIILSTTGWADDKTLTPAVYKKLERAQQALANNDVQTVLDVLLPVTKTTKKMSLDRAMSWQLIGHSYGSNSQYDKAIEAYENSLAQNALTDTLKNPIIINLGQLYISEKRYQQGVDLLIKLLADGDNKFKQNADINILIANGYYELNQFDKAVPHVTLAIRHGEKTRESWHQLLLSLYFELRQYDNAAQQLEKMITLFPDKKLYWKQLSSIYMRLQKSDKALQISQLAWQKGLLDEENDVLQLSNLYMLQNMPFEAAKTLQSGLEKNIVATDFKYWDQLARFYLQAKDQEKAVEAMETAIKFSNDGDDYLTLARVYMADMRWQDAERALRNGREKIIENSAEFNYLLAIVSFELGKLQQAKFLFAELKQNKDYADKAAPWLAYLSQ